MVEPFHTAEGEEEVFKYSLFLVLFNRLSSCIIAICMLAVSDATLMIVKASPSHTSDTLLKVLWCLII